MIVSIALSVWFRQIVLFSSGSEEMLGTEGESGQELVKLSALGNGQGNEKHSDPNV